MTGSVLFAVGRTSAHMYPHSWAEALQWWVEGFGVRVCAYTVIWRNGE